MMMQLYRDHQARVDALLRRFVPLEPIQVPSDAAIPGSYWGAPEAGLVGTRIYLRDDTPVHSALHEAGHFVCMDRQRRDRLQTDAGGDYAEEDAVCYLQVLLTDQLGIGRTQAFADMDAWGYSFRLGSAQAWFEQDAQEARAWLLQHRLIDPAGQPTWRLRA
jgi:hypothetical protein